MARLLEDHALDFLAKGGIEVPDFTVAESADKAEDAARAFGGGAVIKALIPAGGRGKAGAIKLAETPEEAGGHAADLLGQTVLNFPVERVLVSELVDIEREIFASITFDSMTRRPIVLFSALGGIEIEAILDQDPNKLVQFPVEIGLGLQPFQAKEIAGRAGLTGDLLLTAARALVALYRVFCALDAETVEVNPLAVTPEGSIVAPTGVIVVDDQALHRHPELSGIADPNLTNGWRPLTQLEKRMREIDATDAGSAIRFNELGDGRIAFMFTGGGAGFLAFDTMLRLGGDPATTFDITPGFVEEKMYLATKAILARPGLKGLLAGGNITNFIPIDIKVRGVMRALKELNIDPETFPVVFRFAGPGAEKAKEMAAEIPGIEYHGAGSTIEDVVTRIIERTRAP
jgi:succinyl-CoA synthetase beta subunit/citryl-CoA synthetase large subunit